MESFVVVCRPTLTTSGESPNVGEEIMRRAVGTSQLSSDQLGVSDLDTLPATLMVQDVSVLT